MKKGKVNQEDFNKWVTNILALYSKFLEIPENEIMEKLIAFEKQLEKQIKQEDEKSIQLGQDDQTQPQFI
jgi:hypothetical protein